MARKKDYTKIEGQFDERLAYMIENHNKVLAFSYDVRFPAGYPHDGTNRDISKFLKLWKEPLANAGLDLQYVWCREQNKSENPHYHIVALANGSEVQNAMGILNNADKIWGNVTSCDKKGLVNFCKSDVMIRRPSSKADGEELTKQQGAFNDACEKVRGRAEYMSKAVTKGNVPRRVREYGASELKLEADKK